MFRIEADNQVRKLSRKKNSLHGYFLYFQSSRKIASRNAIEAQSTFSFSRLGRITLGGVTLKVTD